MEYSAGAPGVFGSLVRYSIECSKCNQERHEWEHWFKIQTFSTYLTRYNWTYSQIRTDLQNCSDSDWDLLGFLRKDDVSGSRAGNFGASRDKLLRMRVVITGVRGSRELEFLSEMMRRLCLEALPIREIRAVASVDDPLELLAVSLRCMSPSIRHVNVKNQLSPSESVFQFELYASIRGIFKTNNSSSKSILAEARDPYDNLHRRLDIIITNGIKYGYELKSDKRKETEIAAAVQQADEYRQLLAINSMFMVNFIPRGHSLQRPVHNVAERPDV